MSETAELITTVVGLILVLAYPVSLLISYAYFQCKFNYTVKLTEHMLAPNAGPT